MALLTVKNARNSASWNASDDLVRRHVLSLLERSCEIDDYELKKRIEEFERKVQRHKVSSAIHVIVRNLFSS
jgi:hypothetical protein